MGKKLPLLPAVLKYLKFRPRSEAEVRRFLARKITLVPEKLIVKLKLWGLVDDPAFVRWWTRARDARRPRSARMLKAELRQKGIPASLIDAEVKTDRLSELTRAKTALAKSPRHPAAYLFRRGFSWDIIKRAIDASPPIE